MTPNLPVGKKEKESNLTKTSEATTPTLCAACGLHWLPPLTVCLSY